VTPPLPSTPNPAAPAALPASAASAAATDKSADGLPPVSVVPTALDPTTDAAALSTAARAALVDFSAAPAPTPAPDADDAPPALRAAAAVRATPDLPSDRLAPRVISAPNAWIMDDIMHEVITRGTGRRAMALGRNDLSGKTGTTNQAKDTWFNGFNRELVASVWVGFDQERPLGEGEQGARTAVPVWVNFMREALKFVPDKPRPMPDGLVQERISPTTGQLVTAGQPGAVTETFMVDRLPSGGVVGGTEGGTSATSDTSGGGQTIF